MRQPVAVLDADVLVPVLVCDVLLSLFDAELFEPIVSPTILAEVERTLLVDFPHLDPDALRRRVHQMREALALNLHDDGDAPAEALAGVNRKDRHVAALAIAERGDLVVTNDRRLRREIDALGRSLRALTADEFVVRLLIGDREAVDEVIDVLVAKRTRRPITRDALIDQLALPLPRFVAELRATVETPTE
jgi:predicted nucleic acid-binding protein